MTARVNLLPGEVEQRNRIQRERVSVALGLLVLVALLALAYVWKRGEVAEVEDRLTSVEQEVAALEAELAELQAFQELQARSRAAEDLIEIALAEEVSVAGVLQDLAAVMPPDSELSTLTLTVFGPDPEVPLGALRIPEGRLTVAGRTVGGVAPGVERLLLEFAKIAAFDNVYLTQATRTDRGVIEFGVEVDLGPEVFTGRYLGGLPQALR